MSVTYTQLNPDQQLAADKIKSFLSMSTTVGEFFTLTGGPGTGKTFMLKAVLEQYKRSVKAATISHAAKNVLQENLGAGIECVTIANLLSLTKNTNNEGGLEFIRQDTKSVPGSISMRMSGAKVLIIDEVSQIEDKMFDMIMFDALQAGVRVIAVGDPYQLPPVEQSHDSRFFSKIDARLTIPMRFQGPIADLANVYKNEIDKINVSANSFDKWALNTFSHRRDTMSGDTGYQFKNNIQEVIELAAADIKAHPESISYARILAFRNEAVELINKLVRKELYGTGLTQFEPNEMVICRGGYGASIPSFQGLPSRREPVLYNGQILRVASYIPVVGPEGIPCVLPKFTNFSNIHGHPIYIVDHSFEAQMQYNKIRDLKQQEAKQQTNPKLRMEAFDRYHYFLDSFAYFDYAYSVNLYKAQGQTLNNVYVFEGEIMDVKPLTWKQKFQALYVAMTRAKEKLYIYNKEF
jgi:nucleoside-triphosphatase THEP1